MRKYSYKYNNSRPAVDRYGHAWQLVLIKPIFSMIPDAKMAPAAKSGCHFSSFKALIKWCSKPRKAQIFNSVSSLFRVFKDIAVAQKNYFCHSLRIPPQVFIKRYIALFSGVDFVRFSRKVLRSDA